MANETHAQTRQLTLRVHSEQDVVQLGESIPLEVELVNRGQTELVVNSRLSMGYPDSLDRELYCEILHNGQTYTDYRRYVIDYRRKPLTEEFFKKLRPGQGVSTVFDLQEWYHLTEPGVFQVRLVYAPEAHALKRGAVSDKIVSEWVALTVRPPSATHE